MNALPNRKFVEARLAGGVDGDAGQSSLRRAIAIARNYGGRVWIAEGSIHPAALDHINDSEADRKKILRLLTEVAQDGVEALILLPKSPLFAAEDFVDFTHLKPAAARRYTDWLARAMTRP